MKNKCNLPAKISFILLFSVLYNVGFTQMQYTRKFTKLLAQCNASFIGPVEGFYKIKMPNGSDRDHFDLMLESEEKAFELRYKLNPDYRLAVPHISCMTSAMDLAVNDDRVSIEMNVFTPEQSASSFGADWAAYVDFVPKPTITNKRYGRVVTVFKFQTGLMQTVMFFNDHEEEKNRRLYSLTFENEELELE